MPCPGRLPVCHVACNTVQDVFDAEHAVASYLGYFEISALHGLEVPLIPAACTNMAMREWDKFESDEDDRGDISFTKNYVQVVLIQF
jgi:hypothetical protein